MTNYIISTDIDGTLIDHHDYSFKAALTAINRCKSLNIPIILNTSKTKAEVIKLQDELNIDTPLIIENGSALLLPASKDEKMSEKVFGAKRHDILNFIQHVREVHQWQFEGFNDWSVADIAKHTGLNIAQASNANTKQFSEPFIWNDTDDAFSQFSTLAKEKGFHILKGGRFYHLQGNTNKAKPLQWIREHYHHLFPHIEKAPEIIALGDNQNDIAMLDAADIAVCVRSPVADYPTTSNTKKIIRTQGYGPVGWNEAISKILDG